MASTAEPATTKLRLRSYNDPGYYYRDVSTRPPRDCTTDEVPMIDLTRMRGSLQDREALGKQVIHAAETTGFFYICNHGVPETTISQADEKLRQFFRLPDETKMVVKAVPEVSFYGYQGPGTRSRRNQNRQESFNFHYEPKFDPFHQDDLTNVPQEVIDHLPKDSYIWKDVGLADFQQDLITYWQHCLTLARNLIRLLALGLDLPEDYFNHVTTYPGGDMTVNLYPGHGNAPLQKRNDVRLSAHTDLQILTLLWQSEHKGLQILNSKDEWVFAPPIPDTFVVNIGDFLMRLTNDRLKSTVHRVEQEGEHDRLSMAFFFGLNFNEKCGVVPTCVSESNPAKYEPVTCGELIAKRLAAIQYAGGDDSTIAK